jgi:hypothetical protein
MPGLFFSAKIEQIGYFFYQLVLHKLIMRVMLMFRS